MTTTEGGCELGALYEIDNDLIDKKVITEEMFEADMVWFIHTHYHEQIEAQRQDDGNQ